MVCGCILGWQSVAYQFLVYVLFCSVQATAIWMKSFIHMSCKSIRLLETIFSFSKTIPAYLQYGKELFASWSCHTPWLAFQAGSISDRPPLGYSKPASTWSNPFPASTFPEFEHYLVEQWQCIPQGGGVQPQAPFKHAEDFRLWGQCLWTLLVHH